jgi:hypothetical protein
MNSDYQEEYTLVSPNDEIDVDKSIEVDSSASGVNNDPNPYLFRQSILNAIARKNVLDRSKNKLFGTSNKEQRERQIRQVLNEVLSMPNLADYKVVNAFGNATGANLYSLGQSFMGVNKFKQHEETNGRGMRGTLLDPLQFKNRNNRGGKTRRKRKGHGKKSRKH